MPVPSPSPSPLRVALLFGGVSPEHEVSILSASQVAEALLVVAARRPLAVQGVYINRDGRFVWGPFGAALDSAAVADAPRWELDPAADPLPFPQALVRLQAESTAVAMLILHGPGGEDGRLQGALDLARIPYTGSGAAASALALSKPHTQAVLNAAGVPIARSLSIGPDGAPLDEVAKTIGLPCVVKPARGGSSVGVTIVREREKLEEALELALAIDDTAFVEAFVQGRELTCGVLEIDGRPTPLPVTEIIPPDGGWFDYEAKYTPGASREVTPADLPAETAAAIQRHARQAHLAVGCRGFSRVDFMLGERGPVALEVNTIPGMTATSLLPQAAAARGIPFDQLVELMLTLARHD